MQDKSPAEVSKVFGSHFKELCIVDTTTKERKIKVQSSLNKCFDESAVNSAMADLNLMVRRYQPCRKPGKNNGAPGVQDTPVDSPGPSSQGTFLANNTAYLAACTPAQMNSLHQGNVTVITRPYNPHWIHRTNAGSGNGTPKCASVLTMTPGAPAQKAEKFPCISCLKVGEKLEFTLDPSASLKEPDEEDSDASDGTPAPPTGPESIGESASTIIHAAHCSLQSLLWRTFPLSLEELATLRGIVGDINSLLQPQAAPPPQRTTPAVYDNIRTV